MSSLKASGRDRAAGGRLIFTGLLLVAAAPALNLYLDLTPGSARHALPDVLAPAYDQAGKVGVIGVLVAGGVGVLLWGCLLWTAGSHRQARRPADLAATGGGGSRLMRALGAEVTLETARYFREDHDE
jgi:hypothetical protein